MSVSAQTQRLATPGRRYEPFHVVGLDPGGTTGIAVAHSDYSGPDWGITLDDIKIETYHLGPHEHHYDLRLWLENEFNTYPDMEISCEPFNFRQYAGGKRSSVNLISVEYIGVIKLLVSQHEIPYYDGFSPGEAKSWSTNLKLEKVGWLLTPHTRYPNQHMNDALRQVLKYLVVKKHIKHPITTMWVD